MKKFIARIDIYYGCRAEITEVEVEKETDVSVWRKGRRCAKISTYENYYDTWSEARAALLFNHGRYVDNLKSRLIFAEEVLEEMKAMSWSDSK